MRLWLGTSVAIIVYFVAYNNYALILYWLCNYNINSSDWMDDVELAGVCAGSGSYYSAVRWLSLHTLSQCSLGLCRQVRVSAAAVSDCDSCIGLCLS